MDQELLAYERNGVPAEPEPERSDDTLVIEHVVATWSVRPWLIAAGLAAIVLLAVGIAVGVVARNRDVDRQAARARNAGEQVSALRQQVDAKQSTIDEQRRQLAQLRAQRDALQRQQKTRVQRERELLGQTPADGAATAFDDGLYQVRVAIQPGEYRTDGSDNCYWAKLSTGATDSVIVNDLASGPQTVTIDSPYFESEGCGSWTKVD